MIAFILSLALFCHVACAVDVRQSEPLSLRASPNLIFHPFFRSEIRGENSPSESLVDNVASGASDCEGEGEGASASAAYWRYGGYGGYGGYRGYNGGYGGYGRGKV